MTTQTFRTSCCRNSTRKPPKLRSNKQPQNWFPVVSRTELRKGPIAVMQIRAMRIFCSSRSERLKQANPVSPEKGLHGYSWTERDRAVNTPSENRTHRIALPFFLCLCCFGWVIKAVGGLKCWGQCLLSRRWMLLQCQQFLRRVGGKGGVTAILSQISNYI